VLLVGQAGRDNSAADRLLRFGIHQHQCQLFGELPRNPISGTSPFGVSAKFAYTEFYKVRRFLGALRCFVPWSTYIPLTQEYAALVTWGPPLEAGVATEIRL
jgi:hypothetical protein